MLWVSLSCEHDVALIVTVVAIATQTSHVFPFQCPWFMVKPCSHQSSVRSWLCPRQNFSSRPLMLLGSKYFVPGSYGVSMCFIWCFLFGIRCWVVGSQASIKTRPVRAFANGAPSANTRTGKAARMVRVAEWQSSKHGHFGMKNQHGVYYNSIRGWQAQEAPWV